MLEDFRLRTFVAVAEEKSFTKAAARLNVSQPAVSQNISELEKFFGVKFFDRLKGEVSLTPAGHVFISYAEDILARYSELSVLFLPVNETLVRVSASEEVFVYLTEVLLKDFIAAHPELHLELTINDETADLKIILNPINENRGMLALSYHPSVSFSSTRLWKVMSHILKPAL